VKIPFSFFHHLSNLSIKVSPEPEFYYKIREHEKDEFLVLACDGVWDVMTNEDICQFISARMKITEDLEQITNDVIDTCLHKVVFQNVYLIEL